MIDSDLDIALQELAEVKIELRSRRKADQITTRIEKTIASALQERAPLFRPHLPRKGRGSDSHEFVLLLSDLHAGEVVDADGTNQAYSYEIMLSRLEALAERLQSYAANRPYNVSKLHILSLGDMLSGEIHEELSTSNSLPLAEQAVQLSLDCAVWLRSLTSVFKEITFSGVVGNHPRLVKMPAFRETHNNGDWLFYKLLEAHLKDDSRITFQIPETRTCVREIMGHRVYLTHGDEVRGGVGGALKRFTKVQATSSAQGKPIDAFVLGHFHSRNLLAGPAGSIIVMNGSLKGSDAYASKTLGADDGPVQTLLTFHRKRGFTDLSSLNL